jgi:hypothetical protein
MDTNTKKGYDLINRRRKQWVNEEEVRHAWMKGLEEALQIDLDAERAKRDSSYNNVVIEFKGPGLFKGSETSPKFIEATDGRLLKYIPRLAAEQGLDEKDYIGIAIDGDHVGFAQVQDGKIVHQPLMPFSTIAFQMVVDALRANFRLAKHFHRQQVKQEQNRQHAEGRHPRRQFREPVLHIAPADHHVGDTGHHPA